MNCVGIFDSGLGGLTVWQAIKQLEPDLPCLYLADHAHLPYGPRGQDEILRLARQITRQLLAHGAGLIVIACNTASAAALDTLRDEFPATPFVGMEPAVKPAALHTRSGVVGLMATRGTLEGRLLRQTAQRFAGHVEIVSSECPGLAEAIENGVDDAALMPQLHTHTAQMRARGADTIVLGCTHYPLIQPQLGQLLGPQVRLLDPAPAVARQALRLWQAHGFLLPARTTDRFASTGSASRLQAMLERHFKRRADVESWVWQNGELCSDSPPTAA